MWNKIGLISLCAIRLGEISGVPKGTQFFVLKVPRTEVRGYNLKSAGGQSFVYHWE